MIEIKCNRGHVTVTVEGIPSDVIAEAVCLFPAIYQNFNEIDPNIGRVFKNMVIEDVVDGSLFDDGEITNDGRKDGNDHAE